MLWWLKKQYDRRILSYLQYDALKSKYDGSTSIGDIVGADGIAKMQTSMIKDEIDKKAFVIVADAGEIIGEGFKAFG